MSGVKISALPAASAANTTDQLEVNQDGASMRVTVAQVQAAALARVTLPTEGTVLPLQADDAGKLFILPSAASSLVTIPLPPAAAVPPGWSIDLLAIPGSPGGGGIGIRLDAADGDVINDGADASAPGGRLRSRSDGAALRLARVLTGAHAWSVVHKIGNWN
jgi:hypothetical protein